MVVNYIIRGGLKGVKIVEQNINMFIFKEKLLIKSIVANVYDSKVVSKANYINNLPT